jgi:hypothetical protein
MPAAKKALTLADSALVCIYGLVDPRTGIMKYVGRTTAALHTRLSGHMSEITHEGKSRGGYGIDKVNWLGELKRAGLAPSIKVLEEVPAHEGLEAERRWVQSLFKAGVPLTNRQWRPRACVDSPEWLRGFASALVELHRLSGESAAVRCTMESVGATLDKIKKAGLDALDLRELQKCVKMSR